jgi:hypothetical protein
VPAHVCEEVILNAKSVQSSPNLFDRIEELTIMNLRDTYVRLIFTREYNDMVKRMNFMQEATQAV